MREPEPKLKTEVVPIASLSEDPANVRVHSPRNIETIKASLRRFGQQKPIVVSEHDVVVAGNGTLRAAKDIGWETIWIVRTVLAGPDALAYAIADNRTAELAEWANEDLAACLKALANDGFDLMDVGFSPDELQRLLALEGWGADNEADKEGGGSEDYREKLTVVVKNMEVRSPLRDAIQALIEEKGWSGDAWLD